MQGISYTTATQSGTTNDSGEFLYQPGESVTFAIGSLQFPPVVAAPQVSPRDMVDDVQSQADIFTNIALMLQSLDDDGDLSNGITIPAGAAGLTGEVDFSTSISEFEQNDIVSNLVANSGASANVLIDAQAANDHLEQ